MVPTAPASSPAPAARAPTPPIRRKTPPPRKEPSPSPPRGGAPATAPRGTLSTTTPARAGRPARCSYRSRRRRTAGNDHADLSDRHGPRPSEGTGTGWLADGDASGTKGVSRIATGTTGTDRLTATSRMYIKMVWANPFHESLLTFGDDCTRSNAASRIRTRTLTPVERDARARTIYAPDISKYSAGSVIVRANYNVPACHAARLRRALTEPGASYLDRGR
jgi:hypothetical protein